MSAWRGVAIEKLPSLRGLITEAENIRMLWIDLWLRFQDAHRQPRDEATIRGTYEFAWWCIADSNNADIASNTICAFYEDLPTDKNALELLPRYLNREQFLGLKEVFKHHLSQEEHVAFVDDFLRRRKFVERIEKSRSGK